MKRDISTHVRRAAEQVAMTPQERERMAFFVHEYMQLKPRVSARTSLVSRPSLQESFTLHAVLRRQGLAFLSIALVMTGGGVAYAAEDALPGDALYGMKVEVNERVRGALSLSQESDAAWEARRAERRIEEAARLAAQGKLDDKMRSEIVAAFEARAIAAEQAIDRLEEENTAAAIELASHIETTLSTHNAILTELVREERRRELGEQYDESKESEGRIDIAVRNGIERIAKIRVRAEGYLMFALPEEPASAATSSGQGTAGVSPDSQRSAAQRMASAAAAKIDAAKAQFERRAPSIEEGEKERISDEIESASETLKRGDEAFREGRYGAAYRSYQEAYVAAEKLAIYMRAGSTFQVRPSIPSPALKTSDIFETNKEAAESGGRTKDDREDDARKHDTRDGDTERLDLEAPLLR